MLDENSELSDSFRVPCLKEGRMVRLLSQLSKKEEEMFRNMVHRLNTLVQVRVLVHFINHLNCRAEIIYLYNF